MGTGCCFFEAIHDVCRDPVYRNAVCSDLYAYVPMPESVYVLTMGDCLQDSNQGLCRTQIKSTLRAEALLPICESATQHIASAASQLVECQGAYVDLVWYIAFLIIIFTAPAPQRQ